MGMSYRQYLAGARIYGCSACKTHLATIHTMLSRASAWQQSVPSLYRLRYHRRSMDNMGGRTCLKECKYFHAPTTPYINTQLCRVNVIEGDPCDRQMTTGNHTVRDIYCCKCGITLGWKYVRIFALLVPSDSRLRANCWSGPRLRAFAEV